MEKMLNKMLRISTIKYNYTGDEKNGRGMVEFTLIENKNTYYMAVDSISRNNILNVEGWDYRDLSELHIDCILHSDESPITIPINSIIDLPIEKLYLNNVVIEGQPPDAIVVGEQGNDKYVWDNLLMNLHTLQSVTIVDTGILYSLDFTHNPALRYARFVAMDIRDVKGYETHDYAELSFINCTMSEDTAVNLARHHIRCKKDGDKYFDIEFASDW